MAPLKEVAPRTCLRTFERSGTSVAAYVIWDAPANADAMVDQEALPHWSMERSLAAGGGGVAAQVDPSKVSRDPHGVVAGGGVRVRGSDVCVVAAVPSPQSTA